MQNSLNGAIAMGTRATFEAIGAGSINAGEATKQPPTLTADTTVIISIVGELNGALAFRCSQQFAATLAGSMLGIEIEPGSEDMKDAIGELFNMIVGAIKRHMTNGSDPFKVSVPTTIIGQDYSVHISAADKADVTYVPFTCSGHELAIEAYINP